MQKPGPNYSHLDGVYIFGGKDNNGLPTNLLQKFSIVPHNNTFKIETPQTVGITPIERFGHAMHFLRQGLKLVVYGGRNDSLFTAYGNSLLSSLRLGSNSLDDISILNLKYMAWCRVKVGFTSPSQRYNFSSFVQGKLMCNIEGTDFLCSGASDRRPLPAVRSLV